MVSVSGLLNGGLLLSGPGVFQGVASPQQASNEADNILRYLGGSAPYFQRQGYGISTDIPEGCTIEQVQLYSRHVERFPTVSLGRRLEALYERFQNYSQPFSGDLSFLNDGYTYFVDDSSNYALSTSPENSQSVYAGTTNALRHGASFRARYGSLYDANSTLPVFSSNSARVLETSRYFARGFLGDDFEEGRTVKFNVISEDEESGVNTLTPRRGCPRYDDLAFEYIAERYNTSYLNGIAERIESQNPGLNLTADDAYELFDWCAYELNVRGYSPFCGIFTNRELLQFSYGDDLEKYYTDGPGNPQNRFVGSILLNASLALLKDDTNPNKVWLSFAHSADLAVYHAALGLFDIAEDLPTDYIPFPNPYSHASIAPQGARIYTEKLGCGGESYVRYIVNDAVTPISTCADGPGFSCKLDDFEDYLNERIGGYNITEECGLNSSYPTEVSFYWDYDDVVYDSATKL
ncbi:Acid phosphatase PHO11 [Candida viswanathii]|uniref:Acid phosphatase PHO11 n=1 Tax=Candida viswanathii TaxID=5486 RepID=A0A367YBS5_9ASCO|nr:Acid phosphatase PHO11 [Candida viswanathii]